MRYTKKNDFRRNWKFHMENVIAFLFPFGKGWMKNLKVIVEKGKVR